MTSYDVASTIHQSCLLLRHLLLLLLHLHHLDLRRPLARLVLGPAAAVV